MADAYVYGRLATATEARALGEVLGRSFGFPAESTPVWFDNAGRQNVRVLRAGTETIGGLFLLPMGQFFGGRSVPMVGVAAVGIAPHRRGRGAAAVLMQQALRELRSRHVPISALYPAAQQLYRRVGYEHAGARFEFTVPVGQLGAPRDDRALAMRAIGPRDDVMIVEAYRRVATDSPGYLDRSAYIWNRVRNPRGENAVGYAAVSARGVEGYVYVVQRPDHAGKYSLLCTDIVATTPAAARRLLAFVADQRSMATTLRFYAGPAPAIVSLLAEQTYSLHLHYYWMLRIVDVQRAIEARGYPQGVVTAFELDVVDDVLPENGGRWTVSIARGRARVRRGTKRGRSRLRLDVRALAALYSGHFGARALAMLGFVEGHARDLARADAAFAGPAPACADMF